MIKPVLKILLLVVAAILAGLYALGDGWFGKPWQSEPVVAGPRPLIEPSGEPQILFGDLHSHTNYSLDAYVFTSGVVKGGGVMTPADACDFARYCSVLDFWSINDHAESLTPRVWDDTVQAIRNCNAEAGSMENPDLVSFLGWEWSNGAKDNVPSHYGHKNVIFRTWEEGVVPTRPIASEGEYLIAKAPAVLIGLMSLADDLRFVSDLGWYMNEVLSVPECTSGVPANELPSDCREIALTPTELYQKLDEWGLDATVIPHGLAWGTTNPLTADFQNQLDVYRQRYENLVETYSGHGSSELFEDFQRIGVSDSGELYCPEATENFTPCCQLAASLARGRCEEPGSTTCDAEVDALQQQFLEKGPKAGRNLFADASLDDWQGCGQLRNTFQPASMYVPRQSTQYNLALGFDKNDQPKRTRPGLMASSDGHQARPGSSYKETDRVRYTDNKSVGEQAFSTRSFMPDEESGAFYYTGGLVAVHTQGRDRDSIWSALDRRNVYGTSGDRMLVWFDLLNGPDGEEPMGSEVQQTDVPHFRVKALGAWEQKPGCHEASVQALGEERIASLCRGECYQPGERRKAIDRIEIVRIRPQQSPAESVSDLIEDNWKVFQCDGDETGCVVEFEDPEYLASGRPALYYARVIQAAEPLISGDPFGCEYNEAGECVQRNYCVGANAEPDNLCLAEAEPRAWTSPIFLEPRP